MLDKRRASGRAFRRALQCIAADLVEGCLGEGSTKLFAAAKRLLVASDPRTAAGSLDRRARERAFAQLLFAEVARGEGFEPETRQGMRLLRLREKEFLQLLLTNLDRHDGSLEDLPDLTARASGAS